MNRITPSAGAPRASSRSDYIWEIQGLRTLAALLVAVYHIWFQRVSGGVDAFFVIAAFFLMTSFARKERPVLHDLLRYWANTTRRVAPGASIVIVATVAGVWAFLPTPMWYFELYHAVASALFVENWWLAESGIDYLAQGAGASPFQQMWALSLQMQLYFALPLVLWLSVVCFSRNGRSPQRVWNVVLLVLTAASLGYSVYITERNQAWAYFDSFARIWEYSLGALLALNLERLPRLGTKITKAIGYLALVVLVGFAAVLPVAKLFPGYAALVPVCATLAIIWVARSDVRIEPLRWKPLLYFADGSFAFYLWHWPLLIFYRVQSGEATVGLLPGLGVILAAAVLSQLTVRLFETPFRRWPALVPRPVVSLLAAAALMIPPVGAIAVHWKTFRALHAKAEAQLTDYLSTGDTAGGTMPVPHPMLAGLDLSRLREEGCHQDIWVADPVMCSFGEEDAATTVALVGGSHSEQMFPVFERIAEEHGFRLVTFLKSACILSAGFDEFDLQDEPSCAEWNDRVMERLAGMRPDLVVTIATRGHGEDEGIPASFRRSWRELTDRGMQVLALRDNPWFESDPVYCIDMKGPGTSACNLPREAAYAPDDPGTELGMEGVTYLDTSDLYCGEETCPSVIDGLLVYRDRHHLTKTYALTLTEEIEQATVTALARHQAAN